MIDIIFIILVFFVFLIGVNKYENFENDTTPEGEMYQTSQIKKLTGLLDGLTTDIVDEVKTIKGKFTGEIDKIVAKKNWIESCVGCVKFCGKEPYWGTCSRRHCWSYSCDCSWNSGCSTCEKCETINYGCTKWRDKCTPNLPKWNCSLNPSGFSLPTFPSGWIGISEKDC